MNTPSLQPAVPCHRFALSIVLSLPAFLPSVVAQGTARVAQSLVEDESFEQSTTSTLSGNWSSEAGSTLEVESYYHARMGSKYLEVNGSTGNVDVQTTIGAYTDALGDHALMHGRTYQLGVWVGVANTRKQRATLKVERKNQAGDYYVDFEKTLSFQGTGNANQTIGWHYLQGVYHFEDNEGLMDENDPSTVRLSLSVDDTSVFFVDEVEVHELYPDSMKSDGLLVVDDEGFAAGALRIIMTNAGWSGSSGYFELNPGQTGDAANTFAIDGNGLRCTNSFLGLPRAITYTPDVANSSYDWKYYTTTALVRWNSTTSSLPTGLYSIQIRGGAYLLTINAASGYAELKSTSGRTTMLDFKNGLTFAANTDYRVKIALSPKHVGGTDYDELAVTVTNAGTNVQVGALDFDASNADFSQFEYLGPTEGGGVGLAVDSGSIYTKDLTIYDGSSVYAAWDFTDTNSTQWATDWVPGALATTSFPEEKLDALHSFDPGMRIIYSYKLDQTTVSNKVPIGNTQAEIDKRAAVQANILSFLNAVGHKISVFQVDNETMWTFPAGEHTTKESGDDYVRSVEWLKVVAGWVADWRAGTGGNPDLKICTGAIIPDPSLYENLTPNTSDKFLIHAEDMIKWANADENVDFIDVHLFPVDAAELESTLAWLRLRAKKPLLCTEWSQQGGSANFIYNPTDTSANATKLLDATFRNSSVLYTAGLIGTSATNACYVQAAYRNPVPQSEFNAFVQLAIDSGDIAPAFIQDAFDRFNLAGVVYPCYAIHNQYSSASSLSDLQTSFNMLQLWGNLSIQGVPVAGEETKLEFQPLGGFREQWQAASSRILPAGLLSEHQFDGSTHSLQTSGSATSTLSDGVLHIDASTGLFTAWDSGTSEGSMRVEGILSLNSYSTSSSGVGVFAKRNSATGDRYALVYRGHTGQLALSVTDAGVTTDLALQAYSWPSTGTAHFLLEVSEPVIRGYVDHDLVFEVTDSTHAGETGAGGVYGWGAGFDVDVLKIHRGLAREDIDYGVSTDYSWANYGSLTTGWATNTAGQFQQSDTSAGTAFRVIDWAGAQTDYSVAATMSPKSLPSNGSVGLVTRFDPGDTSRYEFVYQPGSKRLALRRRNDSGAQTLLRTMDMTGRELVVDSQYEMAIEVKGQEIKAYWEGFLVFSYYDETPGGVTSGLPGVYTYACTGTFDHIRVETR